MNKIPMFRIYPGQSKPQPAYVSIDLKSTSPILALDADYDHEIGGAVTFDVYHGRVLQLSVEPAVDGEALKELLDSDGFLDLVQVVLDDSTVEWDGQNYVGQTGADADEALEEMQQMLDELPCVDVHLAEHWLAGDIRRVDDIYAFQGQVITPETAAAIIQQCTPTEEDGVVYGLAEYVNDLAEHNARILV